MNDNYITSGYIYSHNIYNEYLVLLIDVYIETHRERMFVEKSILLNSEEFNELLTELRINHSDISMLDGIGILAEIMRQKNGIHTIGKITFDKAYWLYCFEQEKGCEQSCAEMRGNVDG